VLSKIIFRVLIIICLGSTVFSQTVVTDTIFSEYNLDGGICHLYEDNNYFIVSHTSSGSIGDAYNIVFWKWQYCRSYYTIFYSSLPIDTIGFELISATFQLFQYNSHGNDESGVYPIWDFEGGDTNYCYLDHITYGDNLDLGDWTAGDSGDAQTLNSLYTIVSSTPDTGFRNIDVTELVRRDIDSDRFYTQFRIHFPIGTDYDQYMDGVSFDGISYPFLHRRPKLIVEYRIPDVSIENEPTTIPKTFNAITTYPNPFNSQINIKYEINIPAFYLISIYSITGDYIIELKSDFHSIGKYSVQWNGKTQTGEDVPSGIYFVTLTEPKNRVTQKVILLR